MEKEFILPDKWWLEADEDNYGLIDKWRNDSFKGRKSFDRDYYYVSYTGWGSTPGKDDFIITTDQFKKYILNIQEPITTNNTPEDLSYLIDLFKQQQIT